MFASGLNKLVQKIIYVAETEVNASSTQGRIFSSQTFSSHQSVHIETFSFVDASFSDGRKVLY